MIRIVVVEDHETVRKGLCALLSGQVDMDVVGVASNGEEALALLRDGLSTDIILTDLNMPGVNGMELIWQGMAFNDSLRFIILTLHPLIAIKGRALAAGARDCLSKDGEIDDLLTAIRRVKAAA